MALALPAPAHFAPLRVHWILAVQLQVFESIEAQLQRKSSYGWNELYKGYIMIILYCTDQPECSALVSPVLQVVNIYFRWVGTTWSTELQLVPL